MRLWTVHPRFLDARGIVALWREGLLAKAVLEGKTKGYREHPQLIRFRAHPQPVDAICAYLHAVLAESHARGYRFDAAKFPAPAATVDRIEETQGQLAYEWQHLLAKLAVRDPERRERQAAVGLPEPHPLFLIVPGGIRSWEVVAGAGPRPMR